MRYFLLPLFVLFSLSTLSQEDVGKQDAKGQLTGNFMVLFQNYNEDSLIGASVPDAKAALNSFGNFTYTYGKFSAGMRFESYQNAILGFPSRFKGAGVGSRYARYNDDFIDITVGNFYEQFGSGMALRTYWEPNLGIDNALDGVRVIVRPHKSIDIKGIFGQQRLDFNSRLINGTGLVRGVDSELRLNDLIPSIEEKPLKISLGGSFVSKYQSGTTFEKDSLLLQLPNNVGLTGARIGVVYKNFQLSGEYVQKINDPNADNQYIYKEGRGIFVNATYSQKGFGLSLNGKFIDNMAFRSEREALLFDVPINYLPSITKQHTYNLAATLYPYATVLNGESGISGELFYNFKKGSSFGGKYGTYVALNVAAVNGLDTTRYTGQAETLNGYQTNSILFGPTKYVRDINLEVRKKISSKSYLVYSHYYFEFNTLVTPVTNDYKGIVYSHIDVIDFQYKLKPKHFIRGELQSLVTMQDKGNWATALVEYTFSPHWTATILDQYNYGNSDASKRVHYLYGTVGYNHGGTRVAIGYGKRRAGVFCIGGVCRAVPASNGIELTITSSF